MAITFAFRVYKVFVGYSEQVIIVAESSDPLLIVGVMRVSVPSSSLRAVSILQEEGGSTQTTTCGLRISGEVILALTWAFPRPGLTDVGGT